VAYDFCVELQDVNARLVGFIINSMHWDPGIESNKLFRNRLKSAVNPQISFFWPTVEFGQAVQQQLVVLCVSIPPRVTLRYTTQTLDSKFLQNLWIVFTRSVRIDVWYRLRFTENTNTNHSIWESFDEIFIRAYYNIDINLQGRSFLLTFGSLRITTDGQHQMLEQHIKSNFRS